MSKTTVLEVEVRERTGRGGARAARRANWYRVLFMAAVKMQSQSA